MGRRAGRGTNRGTQVAPCLIVAVEPQEGGEHRVTVLPITSQVPRPGAGAVAIPGNVKPRIGLDRSRPAWIILEEANIVTWPGFDLVPQPDGSFVRGVITRGLFERVRAALLAPRQRHRPRLVDRD